LATLSLKLATKASKTVWSKKQQSFQFCHTTKKIEKTKRAKSKFFQRFDSFFKKPGKIWQKRENELPNEIAQFKK
jgi:hypothetical protein